MPKVSVLLPNLNNHRFLPERIDTILAQTFTDWELIIVDGYSDDGAWDIIQDYATRDHRIQISQAPRNGTPGCFNSGLKFATGEYIYIATSDDTMVPECLEKMVAALDAHPECGLCHCSLRVIDAHGNDAPPSDRWEAEPGPHFYGEILKRRHIRFAPYDSLVSMALRTVYTSITQLLIRRSVLDEAGPFPTQWGPFGDLAWQMRAALITNTIHLPEKLATWRRHPAQATQLDAYWKATSDGWFCEMVDSALSFVATRDRALSETLRASLVSKAYRDQQLHYGLQCRRNVLAKFGFLIRYCGIDPSTVWRKIACRLSIPRRTTMDFESMLRKEIARLGVRSPEFLA